MIQDFSTRLKFFRSLCDFTQRDLAQAVGISPKQVSDYEVGASKPRQSTYFKILNALNVDDQMFRTADICNFTVSNSDTSMSNSQADWLIFERKRLGLTRKNLADSLSVADKTIQRWEADTPIPSDKLAAMIGLGIDIQYVLTGQRSTQGLQAEEVVILEKYRQASDELKNKMLLLLLNGS